MNSIEIELEDIYNRINAFAYSSNLSEDEKTQLIGLGEQLSLIVPYSDVDCSTKNSRKAVFVSDFYTGDILMANDVFASLYNLDNTQFTGIKCWQLIDDTADSFCAKCPRELLVDADGKPLPPYTWHKYMDNLDVWRTNVSEAIFWSDGRLAMMCSFIDTPNELSPKEAALIAKADQKENKADNVFPSVEVLLERLDDAPPESGTYLIVFDIVALRKINDAYGRNVGDELLLEISNWLYTMKFDNISYFKTSSDEFVILIQNMPASTVETLALAIKQRFVETWHCKSSNGNVQIFCEITIGIVDLTYDASKIYSPTDLLALLERVLDHAAASQSITIYDSVTDNEQKHRSLMELSFRNCVHNSFTGFEVYFQPIVSSVTGTWIALESLCRWTSPEFGAISPMVFIELAERIGMIDQLGEWVLETSIRQCKQWGLDENTRFFLDVNLSLLQLENDSFAQRLFSMLNEYNYPANKLTLEVTESAKLNFQGITSNAIASIKESGVNFSLDDFGTGYSSFNNLKLLPVSLLKTERSFIVDIENDSYLQYLLCSMVELAHAVSMKVVAEGVETREQLDTLVDAGVDLFQGYYFSKPLSVTQLEENLASFSKPPRQISRAFQEDFTIQQLFDFRYSTKFSPESIKLINTCMQILMSDDDSTDSISHALQLICSQLSLSRVVMIECEHIEIEDYRVEFSWLNGAHADPAVPVGTPVDLRKSLPSLLSLLQKRGLVASPNVEMLPDDISSTLQSLNIKSVAMFPIKHKEAITGLIVFADDVAHVEWKHQTLILIHTITMIIENMLSKRRLEKQLRVTNDTVAEIFNVIDIPVCVSDAETGDLLYANNYVSSDFSSIAKAKVPCHKALYNFDEKCAFCSTRDASKQGTSRSVFEYTDDTNMRNLKVYESIIPWANKNALLRYSVDITSIKQYQSMLEHFASTDALTDTLNRGSFTSQLREIIDVCVAEDKVFTIVFIDIDNLKATNDTIGHAKGDELIVAVVDAVKSCVRGGDLIGRFGGDEFVVSMINCKKEIAEKRISAARDKLIANASNSGMEMSFSYGLFESKELAFTSELDYVEHIIDIADKRMLSFKQDNKKDRGLAR